MKGLPVGFVLLALSGALPVAAAAPSAKPIKAKAVRDLPEPDSPTKARRCPAAICKLTPCTTTWPAKAMLRFSICNKGAAVSDMGRMIAKCLGLLG